MPHGPPDPRDPLVAEGARLAAEGQAIAAEAAAVLADALAAVLADEREVATLSPRSVREAVDFLVRVGRMTAAAGEAVVRRAAGAPPSGA